MSLTPYKKREQFVETTQTLKQPMGTTMFSVNGKNTKPAFVVFSKKDPFEVDYKAKKREASVRKRYTGDVCSGVPPTQEQIAEHNRIQAEVAQELSDFKQNLKLKQMEKVQKEQMTAGEKIGSVMLTKIQEKLITAAGKFSFQRKLQQRNKNIFANGRSNTQKNRSFVEKQATVTMVPLQNKNKKEKPSQWVSVENREKMMQVSGFFDESKDKQSWNNKIGRYDPKHTILEPRIKSPSIGYPGMTLPKEISNEKEDIMSVKKLASMALNIDPNFLQQNSNMPDVRKSKTTKNESLEARKRKDTDNFQETQNSRQFSIYSGLEKIQNMEHSREKDQSTGRFSMALDKKIQKEASGIAKEEKRRKKFVLNASMDELRHVINDRELPMVQSADTQWRKNNFDEMKTVKQKSLVDIGKTRDRTYFNEDNKQIGAERFQLNDLSQLEKTNDHKRVITQDFSKQLNRQQGPRQQMFIQPPVIIKKTKNEQLPRQSQFLDKYPDDMLMQRSVQLSNFNKQGHRCPNKSKITGEFDKQYDRIYLQKDSRFVKGSVQCHMDKIRGREDNLVYNMNEGFHLDSAKLRGKTFFDQSGFMQSFYGAGPQSGITSAMSSRNAFDQSSLASHNNSRASQQRPSRQFRPHLYSSQDKINEVNNNMTGRNRKNNDFQETDTVTTQGTPGRFRGLPKQVHSESLFEMTLEEKLLKGHFKPNIQASQDNNQIQQDSSIGALKFNILNDSSESEI